MDGLMERKDKGPTIGSGGASAWIVVVGYSNVPRAKTEPRTGRAARCGVSHQ